jgi:cysteine desulfurase/selenocysteine lyase
MKTVSAAAAVTPVAGQLQRRRTADDPLGVRNDFPVTREWAYLDGPYITPSPRQAVSAATRFAEAKGGMPINLGDMLAETDRVRERFATLVGAGVDEIGLLFATSEGENIVAGALDLKAGDNVVIDDLHYETTFVLYRHLAATRGIELRIVPSRGGACPPEAFREHVDDRTRLISVAWVSHQNGYHHDLDGLASLAHEHGAFLYADAIQGIGMLELDVRQTSVDFFTAGTYKWLLGGFGVAPFFVRRPLLERVRLDRFGSIHIAESLEDHRFILHDDGRKFGYATLGFGAVYQLGAGLDYLLSVGVNRIEAHVVPLAHRIGNELRSQGFAVETPQNNRSGIVTFVPGVDPERMARDLAGARVKVSLKDEGRRIRVGAALFNNDADVDRLLAVTAAWA